MTLPVTAPGRLEAVSLNFVTELPALLDARLVNRSLLVIFPFNSMYANSLWPDLDILKFRKLDKKTEDISTSLSGDKNEN